MYDQRKVDTVADEVALQRHGTVLMGGAPASKPHESSMPCNTRPLRVQAQARWSQALLPLLKTGSIDQVRCTQSPTVLPLQMQ